MSMIEAQNNRRPWTDVVLFQLFLPKCSRRTRRFIGLFKLLVFANGPSSLKKCSINSAQKEEVENNAEKG
jgi:hypothetical protein